jgi:hypothetical protein
LRENSPRPRVVRHDDRQLLEEADRIVQTIARSRELAEALQSFGVVAVRAERGRPLAFRGVQILENRCVEIAVRNVARSDVRIRRGRALENVHGLVGLFLLGVELLLF